MNRHTLNPHRLLWPILTINIDLLHLRQRRHPLVSYDSSEHRVHPVQMRRLVERDEELRPVRPGSLVRHGQHTPRTVSQRRLDLVVKRTAPDAAAAFGVLGSWVRGRTGLGHEFGD